MKVNGKVIIVTGAGSGLGRALTFELLKRGAKVIGLDISEMGLEETKSMAGEMGDSIFTYVIDLTDKEKVMQLPQELESAFGQIDGLINNAGIIQPFKHINNLDVDTLNKVMQVNFFGNLYMTKTFLPVLIDRPESHIVNVSSMGGFFPVPGQTMYGATKAAVKLLTEGLRLELLKSNVKVSLVLPGGMDTNIVQNSGVEISEQMKKLQEGGAKVLSAGKAAEIVINGMERNKFRILVGKDAKLMSFLYRLWPNFAPKLFAKFIGDKLVVEEGEDSSGM